MKKAKQTLYRDDRVIVRLRSQVLDCKEFLEVASKLSKDKRHEYLLPLPHPNVRAKARTELRGIRSKQGAKLDREKIVRLKKNISVEDAKNLFEMCGDVERVDFDWILYPLAITPATNPAWANECWFLKNDGGIKGRANFEDAWSAGYYGTGMVVAVLELTNQGFRYTHEDFGGTGNRANDWAAIQAGTHPAFVVYRKDGSPVDPWGSTVAHGTYTAYCIVGQDNFVGGLGAAPKAKVMAIVDNIFSAAIVRAVDQGADVISVSYSGGGAGANESAIDYANTNGVPVVWAHYDNTNIEKYTGYSEGVILVTVHDVDGIHYYSYGNVTVSAPGINIYVASPAGDASYTSTGGESLAVPLVASLCALLLQKNPTWNSYNIKRAVQAGCRIADTDPSMGTEKWTKYFGWGMIDAAASLALTTGTLGILPPERFACANEGEDILNFTWTNQPTTAFTGVKLVRKKTGFPQSSTDGTLIYKGTSESYEYLLVQSTAYYGIFQEGSESDAVGYAQLLLSGGSFEFLRYSGVIQPIAIQDAINEKTIQIESYDFLKRMEQFPAAWVSDANGDFYSIPGIQLLGYNEGKSSPETKVCNFKFKYPAESKLPNTEILSVTFGTKNGVKTLRYRSWGWFQWDNGPWTEKDLGEESTIEAWDGSTIKCRFAGFTQDDGLDVVKIKNQAVSQRGGVEISFDDGTIALLSSPFSFIIREEAGPPVVVNDITTACLVKGNTASAIASANDTLYIGALDRFQILEFEFDSFLTGATLTFEYSRSSWEDWSSLLSYSDGTNNFSQSGTLQFTAPTNWVRAGHKVGIDGADDIVVDRYWIRITTSVWGSGEAVIRSIFRNYVVVGQDSDSINIKINFDEIFELDKTENVIIRPSDSDPSVFVPATWKKNLPIDMLLGSGSESDISSSLLAASGFSESCRNVEAIDYTFTKNKMSIWGVPPFPAYPKQPRCVCGGRIIDGAQELFIGVGDEVWRVTEHSGFEFLFRTKAWYSLDMAKPFNVEVRQLNYDSTNEALFGVAWMTYDDNVYRPIVWDENEGYLGRCTPAITFRYDFSPVAPEVEYFQRIIGSPTGVETLAFKPRFLSGEVFHRNGNHWPSAAPGSNYNWGIGTAFEPSPNAPIGEMIPVPEPTFFSIRRKDLSAYSYDWGLYTLSTRILLETEKTQPEFREHYFIQGQSFLNSISDTYSSGRSIPANGPFMMAKPGLFYEARRYAPDPNPHGPASFRFAFGQKGLLIWQPVSHSFVYHDYLYNETFLADRNYISEIEYTSVPAWNFSRSRNLFSPDRQPCCGAFRGDGSIIYGYMEWIEACEVGGAPIKSKSRIRRLILDPVGEVWLFESTSSIILGSLNGRESLITPIDLGYDPVQQVVHVCFFDREKMQYHYAVIEDQALPAAYSIQEGTGFAFDWYRQFKHFVYYDGFMYAICTDDRFQKDDAFLVKVTFSKPTITIEKVAILNIGDYSCSEMVIVDGTIYGISQPSGTLWSYGTKWIPRVQLADFGDTNCRVAATDLCQAANAILRVSPDGEAIIEKRETVPVSSSILEDELVEVKPEKAWNFIFDGCSVDWSFLDKSGIKSWGLTGRNRKILKISNPFIQDIHFAEKVAEIYGNFFFKKRTLLPIIAKFLPHLERRDLLKIIFDGIDPASERSIVSLRLRNSVGQTEMDIVK